MQVTDAMVAKACSAYGLNDPTEVQGGVMADEPKIASAPRKPQHWSVTVAVDGETVLTIESNCLSGVSDIDQHSEAIRTCARHLLGFVGDGA